MNRPAALDPAGRRRRASPRRSQALLALPFAAGACLSACAGPSISVKESLLRRLSAQDYHGAASTLQRASEEYGRRNAVLYDLDMGMVRHYGAQYDESNKVFDRAEKRMDELYTRSATKLAGTLVLNDATVDYAGEPFERALAGAARVLNYALLGRTEDAMVEVRKAEEFLDKLGRSRGRGSGYKDDAFVRYLDSLFYEDSGQPDDARIAARAAARAYAWYHILYKVRGPEFDSPAAGAGSGEVVFIHYAGLAPRKVSRTVQFAWNKALVAIHASEASTEGQDTRQKVNNAIRAGVLGRSITISYPEYRQEPFRITGSEVVVGDAVGRSQIVEDVSAIAMRELQDRLGSIQTRTLARAAIKYLLAESVTRKAEKRGKAAGEIASIFANVVAAATEVADTRSWMTAPSLILMARLRVSPGTYPVLVRLTDAQGAVVSTYSFPNVVVKVGKRTYLTYATAS